MDLGQWEAQIWDGNHIYIKVLSVEDCFLTCAVPHLEANDLQTLQVSTINHL